MSCQYRQVWVYETAHHVLELQAAERAAIVSQLGTTGHVEGGVTCDEQPQACMHDGTAAVPTWPSDSSRIPPAFSTSMSALYDQAVSAWCVAGMNGVACACLSNSSIHLLSVRHANPRAALPDKTTHHGTYERTSSGSNRLQKLVLLPMTHD